MTDVADLVIYGARPYAESVAVRDGRIVAVGSTEVRRRQALGTPPARRLSRPEQIGDLVERRERLDLVFEAGA